MSIYGSSREFAMSALLQDYAGTRRCAAVMLMTSDRAKDRVVRRRRGEVLERVPRELDCLASPCRRATER